LSHSFSIQFDNAKKTSSTIGDVLPMLSNIISRWKKFDVSPSYRQLCFALEQALEHKFDYEINSMYLKQNVAILVA